MQTTFMLLAWWPGECSIVSRKTASTTAVVKKAEFTRAHGLSLQAAMLNRTLSPSLQNRPRTAYEIYRLFRESEQIRVA